MPVTPTPAAQTFANMYGRVNTWLRKPSHTDITTMSKAEVNGAIRQLNSRIWEWSLIAVDITFVTNTTAYDLAAAFKAARSLTLLDSGSNVCGRLEYMDPKSFNDRAIAGNVSGMPEVYTVQNFSQTQQVTIFPKPTSSFVAAYPTGRLRYYARINTLTADGDILGTSPASVPSEVEEWVVWKARAVCGDIVGLDQSRIQNAERQAARLWMDLKSQDVQAHEMDWQ